MGLLGSVFGGGGKSSSSSSQTTTTNNYDQRQVSSTSFNTDSRNYSTSLSDSRDQSVEGSYNTTVLSTDQGALAVAEKLGIASLGNDAAAVAAMAEGFGKAIKSISETSGNAVAAVQASYSNAAGEASGGNVGKMVVLAVVVLGAIVFARGSK